MSVVTTAIEIPDSGRAQRLRVVAGGCSVQGPRRETNEDARYIYHHRNPPAGGDGSGRF
jgi:hypothetical protein